MFRPFGIFLRPNQSAADRLANSDRIVSEGAVCYLDLPQIGREILVYANRFCHNAVANGRRVKSRKRLDQAEAMMDAPED
jgi:hypothetical protein